MKIAPSLAQVPDIAELQRQIAQLPKGDSLWGKTTEGWVEIPLTDTMVLAAFIYATTQPYEGQEVKELENRKDVVEAALESAPQGEQEEEDEHEEQDDQGEPCNWVFLLGAESVDAYSEICFSENQPAD